MSTRTSASSTVSVASIFTRLHDIKLGGSTDPTARRIKRRDLAYILSNLATLLENGLSLPRSLLTLSRERSLARYAALLANLRKRIETGETFSGALATYPETFNDLLISQVKVGERSGTLGITLQRIATQLEQSNDLAQRIWKKLSYPLIVTVAGTGVIVFLLTFVVPQFEATYKQARIQLPIITQFLMAIGQILLNHGWWIALALVVLGFAVRRARRNLGFAGRMDRLLMKLPLLGSWLRDIAVLQFMEVLGVMMESGFKLVDALGASGSAVNNQAMRLCIEQLRAAVNRGEKLSTELDRHADLFPPVVSQLVIVGEQTGNLSKATGHVRLHLRKQIERQAEWLVGLLEPVLTIGMAIAIGVILLAIYLPMFGMIDAVDGPKPPT